jgi:NAD(P)-dependent dehydrogenase (short-subunit alcohol dehydrogenase family)
MTGERIVIVGGTSGIGLGVAKLFAGRGAQVILGSHRQSSIEAALGELGGLDVRGQVVDVTSEDSVSDFLGGIIGEIDHLIYTAGTVLDLMLLTEIDMDVARHYRALSSTAATHCPHLRSHQATYRHHVGTLREDMPHSLRWRHLSGRCAPAVPRTCWHACHLAVDTQPTRRVLQVLAAAARVTDTVL